MYDTPPRPRKKSSVDPEAAVNGRHMPAHAGTNKQRELGWLF
jgi:hypothetical protein